MAVDNDDVIDGIAYDNQTLIIEIYDHLPFNGKFEFDHIEILQQKLNTYLWYIESKQYSEVYPNKLIDEVVINIHFLHEPTENCKKYIDVCNKKLFVEMPNLNTKILFVVKNE